MAHADSFHDLNDIDADWEAGDPGVDAPPRSGARGVVLTDSLRIEVASSGPARAAPVTTEPASSEMDAPSSAPAARVTTVRTRRITAESSVRRGIRGRVVLAAVAFAFALGAGLGAWLTSTVAPFAARKPASSAPIPTLESALPTATASPNPPTPTPKSAATPHPAASSAPGPRPLHPAPSRPAPSARALEAPAKK